MKHNEADINPTNPMVAITNAHTLASWWQAPYTVSVLANGYAVRPTHRLDADIESTLAIIHPDGDCVLCAQASNPKHSTTKS